MPTQKSSSRSSRRPSRAGFSLIELMIVVTITGILAAIAMPTFNGYVQKSRTSEPVQFLGVIKLRQEAYRAEFGQYLACNAVTDPDLIPDNAWVPAFASPASKSRSFPTTDACFNTLGAKPDGAVRFGYAWAAGTPSTNYPGLTSSTLYNLPGPDHYFIARGKADLDDDGTYCIFELTSFTRGVWTGKTDGTWLAQGWE